MGAQPCWRHALREAKLAREVRGFSLRTTGPTHPVMGAAGGFELLSRLSGGQWGGPLWAVKDFPRLSKFIFSSEGFPLL